MSDLRKAVKKLASKNPKFRKLLAFQLRKASLARELMKIYDVTSRNLNWRSNRWYDPVTWAAAMSAVLSANRTIWDPKDDLGFHDGGGYNEFDPERVGRVLYAISQKYGPIEVQPARESSVAVYVRGPEEAMIRVKAAQRRMLADEADFVKEGGDIHVRLWWD